MNTPYQQEKRKFSCEKMPWKNSVSFDEKCEAENAINLSVRGTRVALCGAS